MEGGRGDRDGRADQEVSPWGSVHTPLTVEGAIEARGRFIRAAAGARGWRGVVGKLMVVVFFVFPITFMLVMGIVFMLRNLF